MTQVWIKNENIENEDVWDDTELIKMYENSISSKYEEVKTSVKSQKWTTPEGNKYNWKVGSKCMAPFQEDEEAEIEYFPARIDWIGGENDPKVRVTFDGYGNQETVHIKDLWEEHEIGDEDEEEEEKEEEADNNDIVMRSPTKNQKIKKPKKKNDPNSQSSTAGISKIPVLAPPPPPGILNMVPPDEVEALSSMLMSWYMSGYHTGYYQAISDQKRANSSQKK